MNDLVEKFFKEDLTSEEEESLEALLASSPEDAGRFADKAALAYDRFGLPDPENPPESSPKPGWGLRLTALAFVLALMAGLGWWRHVPGKAAGITQKNRQPALTSTYAPAPALNAGSPVEKSGPEDLGLPTSQEGAPAKVPSGAPGPPLASKTRTYSQLKIGVEVREEGPVTVEILDSTGVTVKNLFTGSLPAGSYAFTWDGKLADGRPAPPGNYRIETRSGPSVQTRDFSIEKKGKTLE